jgi:D-alanyl-lipoteichoic acid acyltransferase DltB (MBOAT superfamily)
MLFNSYEFIFLFLPVTLAGFFFIGKSGHQRIAVLWLVFSSLFYYSWWNPAYLLLISTSIVVNYVFGIMLAQKSFRFFASADKKVILTLGIIFNLSLLGYFKYTNFILNTINELAGGSFGAATIILPLAISFFTFQQITYLVDVYKEKAREYSFLDYCLFVTFFPQLISGPIVHHNEMMPQFQKKSTYTLRSENISAGMTIFIIGLFKKVVLADGVAVYADPVFTAAEQGVVLSFFEAWGGALAYTFQIYFDFSGYSDMAIGLGRMFGVHLPLNFHSPYKAKNIIEFWRRWHITLSRFLRDYLYIPLGGNRKGSVRRYANLMIVMLLGGLWHGAGWTFVAWGALHGLYLMINNAWLSIRKALGFEPGSSGLWGRGLSQTVTFTAVVFAWVLFRAESFSGAQNILGGMAGFNGIAVPEAYLAGFHKIDMIRNFLAGTGLEIRPVPFVEGKGAIFSLIFLLILSWCAPNTQQLMLRFHTPSEVYRVEVGEWRWHPVRWTPNIAGLVMILSLAVISLYRMISYGYEEFIYRFF